MDAFERIKIMAINNYICNYRKHKHTEKTDKEIIDEWYFLYYENFEDTFKDMKGN
jgi:hypothetical protein